MATYEFVMMTEDGLVTVYSSDVAAFAAAMKTKITGTATNPRLRTELQGQPRIAGYHGPCWGGQTYNGEPVIRYEDSAAYAALSF